MTLGEIDLPTIMVSDLLGVCYIPLARSQNASTKESKRVDVGFAVIHVGAACGLGERHDSIYDALALANRLALSGFDWTRLQRRADGVPCGDLAGARDALWRTIAEWRGDDLVEH